MNTQQKSGSELFGDWYTVHLGNLHYEALHLACQPLVVFQTSGNFGDEPTLPEFKQAWNRRFGLQLHLPERPEHLGWYLIYMGTATILVDNMLVGARKAKFQWHVDLAQRLLDNLHACYGTRGYQEQTVTDSAWALVRFEARGDSKYLTIADACLPHIQGPLAITKPAGAYGVNGSYRVSDESGRFAISINGPQTAEFQRMCRVFFDHPILDPRKLAPQAFPIIMSWIFAGGYQDVINYAEDGLSHRHGATYSEARRMLRIALGVGLPAPSER